MRDDQTPEVGDRHGRLVRLAHRLEQTKVSVTTVLLFLVFLALLAGAAAGIGYATHHLLRR